jgi:hypothetical protein
MAYFLGKQRIFFGEGYKGSDLLVFAWQIWSPKIPAPIFPQCVLFVGPILGFIKKQGIHRSLFLCEMNLNGRMQIVE